MRGLGDVELEDEELGGGIEGRERSENGRSAEGDDVSFTGDTPVPVIM